MSCDNRLDFTIQQGETWTRQITWDIDGTAVNITGYTGRMYLKRDYTDTATAFELTTGNGRITLTTPASGIFTLSISSTSTDTLSGEYVYDLEMESGGGVVTVLLRGSISVLPSVTK